MTSILLVCGRKTEYDTARTLQIAFKAQTLPAPSLEVAVALFRGKTFSGVVIDDNGFLSQAEVEQLISTLRGHNHKVPIVALCDTKDTDRRAALSEFGCASLVNPATLIDDLPKSLLKHMI